MSKCILHVTDHEYDRILQLNHDAVVWSNRNRQIMHDLEQLFSRTLIHDLRQYDECRMQKHDNLCGIERIERDAGEWEKPRMAAPFRAKGSCKAKPTMTQRATSTTPDPEMTMPFNKSAR